MIRISMAALMTGLLLIAAGCRTRHEVAMAPVEVKPIHITIDVNVKVDRALDDFFDEIDAEEQKIDNSTTPTE